MLPLTKLERVYPPHVVLSVLTTPHAPTTWGAVTDVSQLYRQHKPSTTVLRMHAYHHTTSTPKLLHYEVPVQDTHQQISTPLALHARPSRARTTSLSMPFTYM